MSAPSRARFNRPQSKTRRPAGTTAVSLFRDDTVPTRVVGWLADLKSLLNVSVQTFWACQSGGTSKLSSRGLSDALMSPFGENPTATLIASGEAKRPDTPKGVHPLVASEVRSSIDRTGPTLATLIVFKADWCHSSRRPGPHGRMSSGAGTSCRIGWMTAGGSGA